ncbi:MAG: DUF3667 domain-containing protein [Candidatus Pseudobacter hemicellulosilyticus]|uniref:DUF3667 domain-containing protein n=1 Tax=Candidatus Pseudobacter hemicellulosilyticus TaxID=3121375 RepID=A0AAJ6BDQ0_9BACT|nr:MAG: DUF3667 domain-containing protein [Pseudobacter sp.]
MSHGKERHEKICLNCHADLVGRYCHVCGQENIEPKETVWGIISHFFNDITHFDGKFFTTVKELIGKPGILPREYIHGRRVRYLHPIRMYVFTSAIFFLLFFSIANIKDLDIGHAQKEMAKANLAVNWDSIQVDALKDAHTSRDSSDIIDGLKTIRSMSGKGMKFLERDSAKDRKRWQEDSADTWKPEGEAAGSDSSYETTKKWDVLNKLERYTSRAAYDSAQQALPEGSRDGWIERRLVYRDIDIREQYGNDKEAIIKAVVDKFVHSFPAMLFISLPLFALFLKLLYVRRKQFYYVDHGIFLIYLYIFTFIFLLVIMSLGYWRQHTDNSFLSTTIGWIEFLLCLAGIYYAYKSMRVFYGQGRGKTLLKFFLFNVLAGISLLLLFGGLSILTVFRI